MPKPEVVEKKGRIAYIDGRTPEWRNWQTRWTQNPVDRKARVGSIPSSGMFCYPIKYQEYPIVRASSR